MWGVGGAKLTSESFGISGKQRPRSSTDQRATKEGLLQVVHPWVQAELRAVIPCFFPASWGQGVSSLKCLEHSHSSLGCSELSWKGFPEPNSEGPET